ncbi:hypothetical protein AEQU3_02683 [Aequorivita antarctica]|nr:hypothetical protein AEQU3_02683 [Aequorivita antarctica]
MPQLLSVPVSPPAASEMVMIQSPIVLSPLKAESGLLGMKVPSIVGTPAPHWSSTGPVPASSSVARISSPLQPNPVPVKPGRSTIVTDVPAGEVIVVVTSPTQVCVTSRLTFKSDMTTSSVIVNVEVTPVGSASGIARFGLSLTVSETVGSGPQVIIGAIKSITFTTAIQVETFPLSSVTVTSTMFSPRSAQVNSRPELATVS